MLATLATFIGIITLIILHELGHFLTAKKMGLDVEEFGIGFPPRITGKKIRGTLYSLNWLPLGGFVKITGEGESEGSLEKFPHKEKLFAFQKPWKKTLVIIAGVLMNFLAGWLILLFVFLLGTPRGIVINSVGVNTPAAVSGIKVNDVVIGFGIPMQRFESGAMATADLKTEFISFINSHENQLINLLVKRGDKEIEIGVNLQRTKEPGHGLLGVSFTEIGMAKQPISKAIPESLRQTGTIIMLTGQSLLDLLKGILTKAKISEGVVGPVGIVSFAYQTGKINLVYLLQLLSIISLNLAVLNLLPFPALDGGHLLFILIEKIKGSPMSGRMKLIANSTGVGLLLILALLLTVRDVQHIFFS